MAAIREDGLRVPHPSRFPPDHPAYREVLNRHAEACRRGEAGYLDPVTGLFAMTAVYLAGRPCCERGCRHCPYVGAGEA